METSKSQQGEIKNKGGFVGGHLRDGQRRKGGELLRSLLSLDLDSGRPDTLALLKGLPYRCFVHTTHKHTPEKPRFRLIIPLSREISEEEYPSVARRVAADIGIELFDDSTYETYRMMFWRRYHATVSIFLKDSPLTRTPSFPGIKTGGIRRNGLFLPGKTPWFYDRLPRWRILSQKTVPSD